MNFWPTLLYNSKVSKVSNVWGHTALTTAFQSGWGLDFDWAIAPPWFFSFQPFFQPSPLESLPNIPYLSHIFLVGLLGTLSFNMLTEACRVCGKVLGLSAIFLSITQSELGVNLLGCPLLGELVSVLNVFHLWINLSTVEWWTSNGLEIAILLFPDWWQQKLLL